MKMFSQKNKKPNSVKNAKEDDQDEDFKQLELSKKSHSENKTEGDEQKKNSSVIPKDFNKPRKPNFIEKLKVMR